MSTQTAATLTVDLSPAELADLRSWLNYRKTHGETGDPYDSARPALTALLRAADTQLPDPIKVGDEVTIGTHGNRNRYKVVAILDLPWRDAAPVNRTVLIQYRTDLPFSIQESELRKARP